MNKPLPKAYIVLRVGRNPANQPLWEREVLGTARGQTAAGARAGFVRRVRPQLLAGQRLELISYETAPAWRREEAAAADVARGDYD